MVKEFHEKGILVKSNGAIGADLSQFGLGFCLLLKSNGSGLYATKDLALARRKFSQFKIDRSIYIVDAAQTHHFQQVFKALELCGFEKARKCLHLAYGQVVLPSGRMSSRKGNVIYFSTLVRMLTQQIDRDFLDKYRTQWKQAEIDEARHAIAVATIRFGMLNHDLPKDIVFELSEWSAKGGMTGPYMLYAYARSRAIVRDIAPPGSKVDLNLLNHPTERAVLSHMHNFWPLIYNVLSKHSPSGLCEYLFELCRAYSSWYEQVSVKNAETPQLQAARLTFVDAFSRMLQAGLRILGIATVERM